MNSRFVVSQNRAAKVMFYQNRKHDWSFLKLRQISSSCVNRQQVSNTEGASQPSLPKKSGSVGFKAFAFALTGFTIGLGYAYVDSDSRRKVSNAIPMADSFFTSIDDLLGRSNKVERADKVINKPTKIKKNEIPEAPKPIFEAEPVKVEPVKTEPVKTEPVKTEPVKTEPITAEPVKLESKKPKETKPEPEKIESKKPDPVPVIKDEPVFMTSSSDENTAESKSLDWKDTMKKFELQEEAAIQTFEAKLVDLKASIKQNMTETLKASKDAVESLNNYRQSLRDALDETKNNVDKELQWKKVTEFFNKQTQSVNEAKKKISNSARSLEDFELMIKDAKNNDTFKNLAALRDGLKELIEQQRIIKQEDNKLKEALIHANVLRSYTNEQKVARAQFLKEIQALQPEGIQGKKVNEDQLSNEEINNLLIHAHKRVLQLQNQIDKIQLNQNQQIQAALEDQRQQYSKLQEQNDENLRKLCRHEFDLEKDKVLEAEKIKTSEEIKQELARQAAAHNNHLAQMLKMQHEELATFYERKIAAEKEKIRGEFFLKVSETLGKINGIEHALKARVNLELQANNASQLWLAVQNLNEILSTPVNSQSELAEIKSNFDTITVSAPENEFVQKLVKSISPNVLNKGVWTEPDLKERFHNVKRVCSRVALIDERGGSLFKYFLSYVQSFFIMNNKIDRAQLESSDSLPKLDEFELSTFNILSYAEYYLEQGHIDLAIKLMRQLKGEPSRVASDWINDATVLLEIKQACQLLTSYISSIYIGTHLK